MTYKPSLKTPEQRAEAKRKREAYLEQRRSMPFDAKAWLRKQGEDRNINKIPALQVSNEFGEGYGRICLGHSNLFFETLKTCNYGDSDAYITNLGGWECAVKVSKKKPFESHPSWRPIAVEYDYETREYIFLESWEDIEKYIRDHELDYVDYEGRVREREICVSVYKHPVQ